MTITSPASLESTRTEGLKSILSRAELLAKEVEEMPDSQRRTKPRNTLSAIQSIGDQLGPGIRGAF
jgi:hypothetical protein